MAAGDPVRVTTSSDYWIIRHMKPCSLHSPHQLRVAFSLRSARWRLHRNATAPPASLPGGRTSALRLAHEYSARGLSQGRSKVASGQAKANEDQHGGSGGKGREARRRGNGRAQVAGGGKSAVVDGAVTSLLNGPRGSAASDTCGKGGNPVAHGRKRVRRDSSPRPTCATISRCSATWPRGPRSRQQSPAHEQAYASFRQVRKQAVERAALRRRRWWCSSRRRVPWWCPPGA
jgi:hypothetical protein